MSDGEDHRRSCSEEIELLVFTMMGVRMGIDTQDIAAMLKPEDTVSQGLTTVALHEKLQFRGAAVKYGQPHILVMKGEGARSGIVIDHPDEIASVKIESIRPLPDVIALAGGAKAVWGAVLRSEEIIFLLDCGKMAAHEQH